MPKILQYSQLNAPPADDDLYAIWDYSVDASNPETKYITIANVNKKRNVDAADANGLQLRDDGSNLGIFIKDGGNVGIGRTTADQLLDVYSSSGSNANIKLSSDAANGAPKIIIENDVQSWQLSCNGGLTGNASDGLSIYDATNSTYRFFIQPDGNIGIGLNPTSTTSSYKLHVSGDLGVTGTNNIVLDSSTGDINSGSGLHLEKSANQNVYLCGDSSASALIAKASNKRVGINLASATPSSTLHVRETSVSSTSLYLENSAVSGRNPIRISQNSNDNYLIWDGSTFYIRSTNAAAGSDSVNFSGGKIALGETDFSYKFNATDSNNIVSRFRSSSNAGSRILLEVGTGDAASTMSSVLAFPIYESSVRKVNWMVGALRNSGTNYFAIDHSTADPSTPSNVAFDGTLNNNLVWLDTSGNIRISGTTRSNGYYGLGGTGAGNHCKGRFLQSVQVAVKFQDGSAVYPALGNLPYGVDSGNGYTSATSPDARYTSRAPHAGRLTQVDITAYNDSGVTSTPTLYFYSGSSLPSGDGDSGLGSTNSAYVAFSAISNSSSASEKKVYADFTNTADVLDFDEGDYLAIACDSSASGDFYANLIITTEFLID